MSELRLFIPHKLTQDEAFRRIRQLFTKLREEQKDKISNVKEEWDGQKANFGFSAMGFNLSGDLEINPASVDINAKLPLGLALFKGKIEKVITEKATELLSEERK